jgi:hypothetical protein
MLLLGFTFFLPGFTEFDKYKKANSHYNANSDTNKIIEKVEIGNMLK